MKVLDTDILVGILRKNLYLGGVPLVLVKGFGYDEELNKRLKEITGLPSTTSVICCMDALRALSIKKLVIATPQG